MVAVELRNETLLAAGRPAEVIAEAERLVRAEPLREVPRRQLMEALHAVGRQAEALATFHDYHRLLAHETGLDPSVELAAVQARIAQGDGTSDPRRSVVDDDRDADRRAVPAGPAEERAGKLPVHLTSFVGRERELLALTRLLRHERLVTLTGPGGSGKTRLALRVVGEVSDRDGDDVFFCDLAPLADGSLVWSTVARSLGLHLAGSEGIREEVLGYLRSRELLLIMDNCEHLVDTSAEVVEAILVGCPRVSVLATSREVLGVEGETVWPVPPLPVDAEGSEGVPAAARLFLDRACAARADFHPTEEDTTAVRAVCQRLDGMPLAIELAAARVTHLSPGEILERLDDRLRLLTRGRTRTPRHQSLEATLDWSHALLEPAEQVLLRRLAVFAGRFTLAAAEAICGDDAIPARGVVDLLGSLVEKSLVVAERDETATHYRLLETIRLYGRGKLSAAGETETLRGRHRDWYLEWLDRFPWDLRHFSPSVAATIQREYDNLRIAIEWSESEGRSDLVAWFVNALTGFAAFNGYLDELNRWREVARAGELTPDLSAALDAHGAFTELVWWAGDPARFDAAREVAADAFAALPEGDPQRALARHTYAVSFSTRPDEFRRMERAFVEAADLAERAEAPWLRVAATALQSIPRLYGRDPAGAVSVIRVAMEMPAWADEHDGFGIRHYLAVALHLLGDDDEALDNARVAAESAGGTWRHMGFLDAALITAAQGDAQASRRHVRQGLDVLEQMRWRHPMAHSDSTVYLGAIATHEQRWEDAARLLAVSRGWASHPPVFVVWDRYLGLVRDALPRDVRRRRIEEGRHLDPMTAIERELDR